MGILKRREKGFLYVALGLPYLKQAIISANSLRYFNPDAQIAVFTDYSEIALDSGRFDIVEKLTPEVRPREQYMLDRLSAWKKSPFKKTVALDSDTYIMGRITDIFEVLNCFDVALTHGHARERRHRLALDSKTMDAIPYAFAPVQGGVVGFVKARERPDFANEVYEKYRQKKYYDDQVSMREIMWRKECTFTILPPEYNFNLIDYYIAWLKTGFAHAEPRIFHYTTCKDIDIEEFIETNFEHRFVAPRVQAFRNEN